jgi:sulfotransferase family protein
VPGDQPLWYQKHMAHHLLPHMAPDWIAKLTNVLLIRDPGEVVASYIKSRANVTAEDIGLPQQTALYDEITAATGTPPPVIDAGDFLRAPEAYLLALCARLGIAFTDRMLKWPPGRRATDGIWAPYWYAAVEASSGFEPWRPRDVRLEGTAAAVVESCRPHYLRLYARRMVV